MVTAIIAAAGSGVRAGFGKNKLFKILGGKTVLETTFDAFKQSGLIGEYVIVAAAGDAKRVKELMPDFVKIAIGGQTRTESVKSGLAVATGDIVLIHDGARPFVTTDIIRDCIESVRRSGSGIAAYQTTDTVAEGTNGVITGILGKTGKYIVQTPQGFFLKDIKRAYELAESDFPDDSSIYARYIGKPHISKGSADNRKLTYAPDFERDFLIGTGFDAHRFAENRKLILGGVVIPHDKGLLGHSDADVLTHAIMDAMLSAAGLRDIGYYFPDTDPSYKDISSMLLLERVAEMLTKEHLKVKNVSASILAEKPKLKNHIPSITTSLAHALSIDPAYVGIGATTTEGLGFVGREEGIAVYANVLLVRF